MYAQAIGCVCHLSSEKVEIPRFTGLNDS